MKKIEREDWFTAGLGILNTGGFLKITIENLCEVLKVTKGSFYHHFKNVDGYIDAFMSYWVEKNTKALIEIADQEEIPRNKVEKLNQLVFLRPHKSEQVIRGWSFSNEVVKKFVAEVDQLRIDYTAGLKVLCGESPDAASQLALLEYACLIGIQQLYPELSPEKQLGLYELFHKRTEII